MSAQRSFEREDSTRRMAAKHGVSHTVIARHRKPAPRPTFDADGYPTDETLETIAKWRLTSNFAVRDLLNYVGKAWAYNWPVSQGGRGREKWIRVATGGWSGNEDLIAALQRNHAFWAVCWLESTRGGSYKFLTKPFDE